ncbi:pirin-like C-terminal cupin domain-containing protein [Marinobacterium aestuariivivens]|uniref:Pirin-like C-terminal cupin domain-containing protein n=1 Tax=Marinobacterium aestuariivivens TaxID=1698799 RepID=A0ABW2A5E0_9GAMM
MNVWDLRLKAGGRNEFTLPAGWSVALVVLHGEVRVNAGTEVGEAQMAVLGEEGQVIDVEAGTDSVVLLLSGEPIDEPIVGHGPFVMNTEAEIAQAIRDFNSGAFGRIAKE